MIVKINDHDITNLLFSYSRSMSMTSLIGNAPVGSFNVSFDNEQLQYSYTVLKSALYSVQPTDTSSIYYYKAYETPETYDNVVTLKLYDANYEFESAYVSTLSYPATIKQQLDEIALLSSIEIDYSAVDITILNKTVNEIDKTYTMRSYLRWIAEISGCNVLASTEKYAKIFFKKISSSAKIKCDDAFNYSKGNTYEISGIQFDNSEESYIVGTQTGNIYLLSSDNPYITSESDMTIVQTALIGLSFYSATNVEIDYFDNLTLGDIVNCADIFEFVILDYIETFNGGTAPDIVLSGELESENSEGLGNEISAETKIRLLKIQANEIETKVLTVTEKANINAAEIETLNTNIANIEKAQIGIADVETLLADEGYITKLEADKSYLNEAQVNTLIVEKGYLDEASVNTLIANKGYITSLEADELIADKGYITELEADTLITNKGYITELEADTLITNKGYITELQADKLITDKGYITTASVNTLLADYATVDFANIGEAAIEKLFADSGIIKDLVMKEGYVTGELVGVTIKGDIIEGGTIVADKLVIQGTDGLYYRLNTDGETVSSQQTEYNSLSGTVITAKSVTADKVNVSDLVAFDATIGGFNISENSIYSGVKNSVDNTTRGLYLDKDGQVAFGDAYNFIKYFKDTDGNYKLDISADTVHLGSSGKNVEEILNETVRSQYEEFYQSSSPTELIGGSWSDAQPVWQNGKYIWKRTIVTYNDGTTVYMPSEEGLCITGNTGVGEKGDDGVGIDTALSGVYYQVSSSGTELIPVFLLSDESGNIISDENGNYILSDYWSTQIPAVSGGQYLWSKTVIAYTDGTSTESYSVTYIPKNGEDGNGISLITEYYAISSSSSTVPSSWSTVVPTMNASNKYLWNYEVVTYTNGSTEETSKRVIGVYGETGKDGVGISKIANYYLASASSSGVTTSTSGWTEDIQTITESKKHLWNYEVVTYTDGTAYTSEPCIIGVYGLSGADGTGVESITAQYYVSDSKEQPVNGEWTTKTPAWSVGKYLWVRYAIVYTNSTTPVNTTPYCDSSWEAVNEIKIGGRNLLTNSNFASGDGEIHTEIYQLLDEDGNYIVDENGDEIISEDWYPVTPDHWVEWGSPTTRELILINEEPWVHIITDPSASTKYQGYQQSVTEGISGYEYTVQARFRTDSISDVPIAIGVHCRDDSNAIIQQFWFTDSITRNNGIYILYGTFTFPSGATNFNVMIGTSSGLTDIYDFYFTKVKLEYGNKITDWSLANDDIPSLDRVDNIDANLSNLGQEFEDMEAGISYRLDAIENFISMGITDEDGASLVTQTDNGWTWSLGDTLESLKGLTEDIDDAMTLANNNAVDLDELNQIITSSDVANKLAYIFVDKVEDDDGVMYPVMTFGNSTEFALQITNTAINFKYLNETIAYISNEKLHISKADVDDELEFGDFAWKTHGSNGNIGLIWKGS